MPVYVIEPISPRALARLKEAVEVVDWRDPGIGDWPDHAEGLVVRIRPIPAKDVARSKKLKVIGKHGVGFDNIPLDAARAKGITVVNTPGANADGVAELVLGLAIAAARHVVAGDRALRAGTLGKAPLPVGRELAGRPVGIAGFGAVGRKVARLFARAFDAPVSAYDPMLPPEAIRAGGAEPVASLEPLLEKSAVLSLNLPLTPQTRNLIGANALARMAPDSILVNTARGGIVDEMALAEALAKGRPGAAAGDVFAVEPPPPDHPLLRLSNFIATPHLGSATQESLDRVGLSVVEQMIDVLEGRRPPHVVG
ncbi:MAG TPA: hydroxyacid dehydrogenase [Stellaceae bacterium]|nr:hydroxyacid dehydrogenase [Stellaceae bacterium]